MPNTSQRTNCSTSRSSTIPSRGARLRLLGVFDIRYWSWRTLNSELATPTSRTTRTGSRPVGFVISP
jgi:hypothetical protein